MKTDNHEESVAGLDELETAVDGLIAALRSEREKNKDFRQKLGELELQLSRAPKDIERLEEENRRLKRNMELASDKIANLLEKI